MCPQPVLPRGTGGGRPMLPRAARVVARLLGALALLAGIAANGQAPRPPDAGVIELHPRSDVTVVSYSGGCKGATLHAEFEYDAAGVRSVQSVRLGFNGIYPEGPRLRVDADGTAYDLGLVRKLTFEANRGCRNLAVAHGVAAERAVFLRMMKAKSIVMRIGDKKMALSDTDIEGLRALAKRLQ